MGKVTDLVDALANAESNGSQTTGNLETITSIEDPDLHDYVQRVHDGIHVPSSTGPPKGIGRFYRGVAALGLAALLGYCALVGIKPKPHEEFIMVGTTNLNRGVVFLADEGMYGQSPGDIARYFNDWAAKNGVPYRVLEGVELRTISEGRGCVNPVQKVGRDTELTAYPIPGMLNQRYKKFTQWELEKLNAPDYAAERDLFSSR